MAISASWGSKLISPRPQGTFVNAHHSAEMSGE